MKIIMQASNVMQHDTDTEHATTGQVRSDRHRCVAAIARYYSSILSASRDETGFELGLQVKYE
jgi:hypothetical protein